MYIHKFHQFPPHTIWSDHTTDILYILGTHPFLSPTSLYIHGQPIPPPTSLYIQATHTPSDMSLRQIVWVRLTDDVRWYFTSSFKELNLTTHRKYFPAPSRNTLKCWTLSSNLRMYTHKERGNDRLGVYSRYKCASHCSLHNYSQANFIMATCQPMVSR